MAVPEFMQVKGKVGHREQSCASQAGIPYLAVDSPSCSGQEMAPHTMSRAAARHTA